MVKHKDGCKFKDFYKSFAAYKLNGPDAQMIVSDSGIEYSSNIHTVNKDDSVLAFNFCPCCGEAYT
ncbi:MAG: hypothetical protein M0R48_10575 [Candidatus Omnitrophica bacterium]|nr:hypothetical protein [Candidatus Omnitrophota bacterium]